MAVPALLVDAVNKPPPGLPGAVFEHRKDAMSIAIAPQPVLMTSAGHDRLHNDLDRLTNRARQEIAERLRIARSNGGDPVDNGDLADALEEQTVLEHRIAALESLLADAQLVPPTTDGTAGIGTIVQLRTSSGDVRRYKLVGAGEVGGQPDTISVQSPVGQALQGRRPGDRIEVEAPLRVRRLDLLSVEPIEPTEGP
jgi:transcription elongation factor GreA